MRARAVLGLVFAFAAGAVLGRWYVLLCEAFDAIARSEDEL